jgi:hypothetical protein
MRFLSDKIRIEILLPLYYNDKTQIEPGKFLKTRNELTAKFGGCTVITPAEGSWIDKGIEYNDINSGFYVIAPHTEVVVVDINQYHDNRVFKHLSIYLI